jgi:uncharacterized protein YjbI with pentapeptide repeats
MANEEHLAILRQGVEVWNKWREANPDVQPDLSGADLYTAVLSRFDLCAVNLSGADLSGTFLIETHLSRANLAGANLSGARLHWADLSGANLVDANLVAAKLEEANLNEAILSGADLDSTNLKGATLRAADLRGARLLHTDLTAADLNNALFFRTLFAPSDLFQVKGLDTIVHNGPATISIKTLTHSGGNIPESFLRGCGVPESFIEYLPALIGAMEPIQFYSCFISYSTKDEEFAKRLHSRMRDHNLRVWFANEDLKGGRKLHEQIDEAIRVYDKFIIVLSPKSLRSKWVMNEVRRTRKAELANNQRKFFPIALMDYRELEAWECLDPETGTDFAVEIREYYVPDFRDWKNHDSFEKAFAQLLEGLKDVDEPPAPRTAPKIGDPAPNPSESKHRRLRILEDQQARMGVLTPPHIIMEIEDLRKELEKLDDSQQP